jgi:hypothetical protein
MSSNSSFSADFGPGAALLILDVVFFISGFLAESLSDPILDSVLEGVELVADVFALVGAFIPVRVGVT